MKITKTREGQAYRVHVDGRPTSIVIEKGPAPKYGMPQEWDLATPERYLFSAKGLHHAITILETVAAQLVTEA